MDQYRDFTNGAMNFPVDVGEVFLAKFVLRLGAISLVDR